MTVHLILPGQFDNVGDTMHRKVILRWLETPEPRHVFVGAAPASFISGLGLRDEDEVYDDLRRWYRHVLRDRSKGGVLAFSPGEVNFGGRRLAGEMALQPAVLKKKMAGGRIVRVGIAPSVSLDPLRRRAARVLASQTDELAWRVRLSPEDSLDGETVPDLAFALGGEERGSHSAPRDRQLLTVTMRGDLPEPSSEWVAGVRGFAESAGLKLQVVTQVRRDNDRALWLGHRLSADVDVWGDEESHAVRERRVRDMYMRSRLVVSDRLHALIAAATEGALPVGLLLSGKRKVQEHFDVIGVEVGVDTREWDAERIQLYIQEQCLLAAQTQHLVNGAKRDLDAWGTALRNRLELGAR